MNRKLRIAVIGLKGLPAFGGAAAAGENIIMQLKNEYVFTVYATKSHTHLCSGEFEGFNMIVIKNIRNKRLNTLWYYIASVFHALFSKKYDLVHLHHRDAAFLIPFLRIRYKVILTLHGFGTKELSDKWNKFRLYFWIQEKVFVKMANHITSVSKADYDMLKTKTKSKCSYIPNGIRVPKENEFVEVQHYDIVFAAGRIVSFKGCHILLKALVSWDYPGTIAIIGLLDEKSKYGNEIIKLSKSLNVVFLGLIKDKIKLYSIIKNASVFVFPSLTEAMSMMLLEAVACKTPVIASNIAANTNLFDKKEVLFFDSGDAESLGSQIKIVFSEYISLKKMTELAFQKVEGEYQMNIVANEYNNLFRRFT